MMTLDDDLLARVAGVLDARIGLKAEPAFRPRLARVLQDVGAVHHLEGTGLAATIESDPRLLADIIDRVTVQETGFFRHPEQFATLTDILLPQIDGPARIWSAAAANGQEPYSLAMSLREAGHDGTILATDVAPSAVRCSIDASYHLRELRGISPERRARHFSPVVDTDRWRVRDDIRELVSVRSHNLLDPIPDEIGRCHIVFCRNVLIYFAPTHAASLLDRLADAMAPNAWLVIGAAETIWHVSTRFEPQLFGASYVYRLRSRRSAAQPTRTTAPLDVKPSAPASASRRPAVSADEQRRRNVSTEPLRSDAGSSRTSGDRQDPGQPEPRIHGDELMRAGDAAGAVLEYRRWTYGAPDDPLAYFHLGAALGELGDPGAARRAYRTALVTLDASPTEVALGGYERSEFRQLLLSRSTGSPGSVSPTKGSAT